MIHRGLRQRQRSTSRKRNDSWRSEDRTGLLRGPIAAGGQAVPEPMRVMGIPNGRSGIEVEPCSWANPRPVPTVAPHAMTTASNPKRNGLIAPLKDVGPESQ